MRGMSAAFIQALAAYVPAPKGRKLPEPTPDES